MRNKRNQDWIFVYTLSLQVSIMLLKNRYIPDFHFRSEYWLFWVQVDQWNLDEFQYTSRSYIYICWRVGGISSCFFSMYFFFLQLFMQCVQHFFSLHNMYIYVNCRIQHFWYRHKKQMKTILLYSLNLI